MRDPGAFPASGPPPRQRKAGRRLAAATLGALLLLILLLPAPLWLIGREIAAPPWLRERVEQAAAASLGEDALRFGALRLEIGRDLHPRIRLLDVSLSDGAGRVLARVPELAVTLSPRGLILDRRLLVQQIALRGAVLSLRRGRDGQLDLAFGGDEDSAPAWTGATLLALPERFEALFDRPALAALQGVRVEGLVVNYEDARAGRSWTLDGGMLALDLTGGETKLTGEVALLSGRAYASRARLVYESPRGSPAARIGLTMIDVAATDVASQSPALAWLGVVDAPLSLSLRAEVDANGALGPVGLALKMAAGALRPDPAAPPVGFDLARAYLSWNPEDQTLRFDRVEVRSDWGSVRGEGQAALQDIVNGLPRSLIGQFTLRQIVIDPPGLYPEPLRWDQAGAQFRLRLQPFALEVAQADVALGGDEGLTLSGRVRTPDGGWEVALDARAGRLGRDRILALWPQGWRPGLRAWLETNLLEGALRGLAASLRLSEGQRPQFAVTSRFEGTSLRPLPSHPPIEQASGLLSWDEAGLAVSLDAGTLWPAQGGALRLDGSALVIPPAGADAGAPPPARLHLRAEGAIEAALSVLDVPAWRFLSRAGLPVALAEGQARLAGTVDLRLGRMRPGDLRYDLQGLLTGVQSDRLVPGRRLEAEHLTLAATEAGIEIAGTARLDGAEATGTWRMVHADRGASHLEADVAVSPPTLAALGIALPEGMLRGAGSGRLVLDLRPGQPPAFSFRSTLEGLALAVPQIGWSKAAAQRGTLVLEGRLGRPPVVERLALDAAGLSAQGSLRIGATGGLERLDLDRLQVGDWLDAPVSLLGPGMAIELRGGTLDLARAQLGSGGGGRGGGGPITGRLDRVQVTGGLALTDVTAVLNTAQGLEGRFSGQVNGGPTVTGRLAPQGGRVGARVQGSDAGAVLRAAGFFAGAEGGTLDLLLLPAGSQAWKAELFLRSLRVREAPALAHLLNAVSVVGLLQQLGGPGILFDEVQGEFRIEPGRVTVQRSSAVGAGLGLSVEGSYDLTTGRMELRGVLSPFYLVNGIGALLTRRGEGLFGFDFTLEGPPEAPSVAINPLSALTPGFLREIFRAPPPA